MVEVIQHVQTSGERRPVCFAGNQRLASSEICQPFISTAPQTAWRLSDDCRVAFSRLLPILACGEESAIHVFSSIALLQPAEQNHHAVISELSKQVLANIARDELRHEAWLAALSARLCDTQDNVTLDRATLRQARRFFASLNCNDLAIHFVRIAALDSAVCQIFAPLLSKKSPLSGVPEISVTLNRIRADEGRHVRVSKEYAIVCGATNEQLHTEWHAVRYQLATLLETVGSEFETLGADPDKLFDKLKRTPELLIAEIQ